MLRWSAIAVVGAGVVAAGAYAFDVSEERMLLEDTKLVEAIAHHADLGEEITTHTDLGNHLSVLLPTPTQDAHFVSTAEESYLRTTPYMEFIIRRAPADDRTNCHGWVFTGGRYIVKGHVVDQILADNGYQPINEPRPGDLVVYRSKTMGVSHSAIVRYVSIGMPVLVEGKWGSLGVFLHPVEKSCYGQDFKFYRSTRTGHLLAGMTQNEPRLTGAE